MSLTPSTLTPALLAPGDGKSAALDTASYQWTRLRSVYDDLFHVAYDALWKEFGAAAEMESREVLDARFKLGPTMHYEMVLVQQAADEAFAAVRDHTAVWTGDCVVVHLSHVLVAPEQRRTGLAGWMRAVPILCAREVAAAHGKPQAPITLVGEMEYDDGQDPRRAIRLTAYEKAGYVKIDPSVVRYYQPDFRAPEAIDASGGASPLPFQLLVRRVGREQERTITGAEVRQIVQALYAMYAPGFRAQDMQHSHLSLETYPSADASIDLVPPTTPA